MYHPGGDVLVIPLRASSSWPLFRPPSSLRTHRKEKQPWIDGSRAMHTLLHHLSQILGLIHQSKELGIQLRLIYDMDWKINVSFLYVCDKKKEFVCSWRKPSFRGKFLRFSSISPLARSCIHSDKAEPLGRSGFLHCSMLNRFYRTGNLGVLSLGNWLLFLSFRRILLCVAVCVCA